MASEALTITFDNALSIPNPIALAITLTVEFALKIIFNFFSADESFSIAEQNPSLEFFTAFTNNLLFHWLYSFVNCCLQEDSVWKRADEWLILSNPGISQSKSSAVNASTLSNYESLFPPSFNLFFAFLINSFWA